MSPPKAPQSSPTTTGPVDAGREAERPRLRRLVLIPTLIVTLLGLIVTLVVIWGMLQLHLRDHSALEQTLTGEALEGTIERDISMLGAAMLPVLNDQRLARAFVEGDRTTLLNQTRPLYEMLQRSLGITRFYFTDAQREVFLRVHAPQKFGDRIDRVTAVEAQRTGERSAGIELGPLGTLTLRVVEPWVADGRRIGYVELGTELSHVLDMVARVLDERLHVLVHKAYLERARWEARQRALGRRPDWDRLKDWVVVSPSPLDLPEQATTALDAWLRGQRDATTHLRVGDRRLAVATAALSDIEGRPVGSLLMLRDATHEFTAYWHAVRAMTVCGLAAALVLGLFLWRVLGRVQRDLTGAHRRLLEENRTRAAHLLFLSQLMEAIPSPIFYKDREGRYQACNQAFEQLIGRPRLEIIGRTARDLAPGELAERYMEMDRQLFTHPGRQRYEAAARRDDGRERQVIFHKATLVDADGRVSGLVGVVTDITEQKQVEQDLREAKRAAEAAATAKSEFLANMSHEIRTPMTAILGYADLLGESIACCGVCPEHQNCSTRACNREHLQTIARNGRHLLAILNDILDLSKIEAGRLDIDKAVADPQAIVEEVASLLRVRAREKGLSLATEFGGSVPRRIRTDAVRLRQILMNLVGNAVKFTESGGVRIVVRAEREPTPRMTFQVIDTGIGLTPEQMGRLFQRFTQADGSTARRFGGTGLGLTISSRLAEMLGGTISVDSKPQEGSTFTLTIDPGPLEDAAEEEAIIGRPAAAERITADTHEPRQPTSAGPLSGRVLLAEDGPDNQRLVSFILRKAGLDVELAENGVVACAKVADALAGQSPYDLVLMDMQMPEMDGYAATQRLRTMGFEGPIIALTAHAMSGDREKCLRAGCDDYATKPVNRPVLLAMIARHLSLDAGALPPGSPSGARGDGEG